MGRGVGVDRVEQTSVPAVEPVREGRVHRRARRERHVLHVPREREHHGPAAVLVDADQGHAVRAADRNGHSRRRRPATTRCSGRRPPPSGVFPPKTVDIKCLPALACLAAKSIGTAVHRTSRSREYGGDLAPAGRLQPGRAEPPGVDEQHRPQQGQDDQPDDQDQQRAAPGEQADGERPVQEVGDTEQERQTDHAEPDAEPDPAEPSVAGRHLGAARHDEGHQQQRHGPSRAHRGREDAGVPQRVAGGTHRHLRPVRGRRLGPGVRETHRRSVSARTMAVA